MSAAGQIRAMVKAMQAAGCPVEQIVEAVLAYEVTDDAERQVKTSAALRQQRYRERKKVTAEASRVTPQDERDVTSATTVTPVTPSVDPSRARVLNREDIIYITPVEPSVLLPQTENRTEPPTEPAAPIAKPQAPQNRQTRRADRGERIPADWKPDPAGRQFAAETLGNPAAVDAEVERFRDYWQAKPGADGRKADWSAAWRIWTRRAAERLQPASAPQNVIPWSTRSTTHDPDRSAAAAARRLVERLRSESARGTPDAGPLLGSSGR